MYSYSTIIWILLLTLIALECCLQMLVCAMAENKANGHCKCRMVFSAASRGLTRGSLRGGARAPNMYHTVCMYLYTFSTEDLVVCGGVAGDEEIEENLRDRGEERRSGPVGSGAEQPEATRVSKCGRSRRAEGRRKH